ncbi:MAG TPA: hypothetical protein PKH10_00195 [bacterium]|nr:hypothetical protein [bacterium]
MKDLVVKGDWWFPGKEQEKVRGELRFSEEKGSRLFLAPSNLPLIKKTDIILGLTDNNDKITLYDCYLQRFGLIGLREYEFESRNLFWGVHFEDIPHFSRIDFQSETLSQWVNIDGFTHREDITLRPGESAIFYKKPEDVKLGKWDCCTCYLIFKVVQISSGRSSHKQELKQEVSLRLDYEEEVVFIDIESQAHALMNMLAFAADSPVYSNEMTGYTLATGEMPIGIYSRQHIRGSLTKEKEVSHFLFEFTDVHEHAPQFIEKWIDLSLGDLSPFTNNYIAEKYIPSGFVERKFLEYVRCLEVYHRKTSRQNSMKLKERLLEIVGKYRYNIELFSDYAVEEFCERAKNGRHYLTHYEEKADQERMSLNEMVEKTNKMKILIDICLLAEMGFSKEDIDRKFHHYISMPYRIMAADSYIEKHLTDESEKIATKKAATYLIKHCSNEPYVILALCNMHTKEEREELAASIKVLKSIGMLQKLVSRGNVRIVFSKEYEKYVDKYYREKKKEEEEVRSTSKRKGKEEGS